MVVGILLAEPDGTWPTPYVKVASIGLLAAFPPHMHGLGTSLTAHEADRLALDNLRLGVDAGAGAVTQTVAHDLGQVGA